MNASPENRSPLLMSRDETALLVVDVQDKLVNLTPNPGRLIWNIGRLIDGAGLLHVPVFASEQYPQGLGPTTAELAKRLDAIETKTAFSCCGSSALLDQLRDKGLHKVLVVGMETHVCVQQTVLDLLHLGFQVYIAVDAVVSRHPHDHDTALRRMDSAGATLTTAEAALFEWCQDSAAPEFKSISQLVRQTPPDPPPSA